MICLGFYLAESVPKPDWCSAQADRICSVGFCNGRIHPDLRYCYFINSILKSERRAYAARLGLDDVVFREFSEITARLIEEHQLSFDGRFRRLSDARRIRSMLHADVPIQLIGVFGTAEDVQKLTEDGYFNGVRPPDEIQQGITIGYDILGIECFDPNTFSCDCYLNNSLEQELSAQFELQFDSQTGLLLNDFAEVQQFADFIQGMGEPVVWRAYLIYEYDE